MALNLFSYFIVPALTLLLVRGTNWFSTNFSSISVTLSRQEEFLIWSLSTGGYFGYALLRLIRERKKVHNIKKEAALLLLSAGTMVIFVLTPYLPARFPFLSAVHVATALTCSILFFLCLLLLTLKAYLTSPQAYRACLLWLYTAAVACVCLFLLTGIINSAMEICFVITSSLLCRKLLLLEKRLHRE